MNAGRPRDESGDDDVLVVEIPERSAAAMALKRAAQVAFSILVLPRLMAYKVGTLVWGRDRAFLAASESIARIPGMRGVYCRQAFYRRTLATCGQDVYFGWGSVFSMPQARVGEGVYIGRSCSIGFADIAADTMLADGVQVLSGGREHGLSTHTYEAHRDQRQRYQRVEVGRGAWIGTQAILMAGVGDGAVVGAGAVVSRAVPARTVAAGVPARVLRALE